MWRSLELDGRTGQLPPGTHEATWEELVDRFGWNPHRRTQLDGLADVIALLTQAGCARVWINGSFVTTKEQPEDFDACWDLQDVDLDRLDPVFFELADGRRTQKRRFGGGLLPNVVEAATGFSFDQFFQVARDGTRKGIVVLSITEEKP